MAQATLTESGARRGGKAKARAKTSRRFVVDLWATSLNDVEIGIYQHTRNQAKSDQFTKDMDVIGEVKVDGERKGLLAYRMGLWNDEKGARRRLSIKLFSETLAWRGAMELMVGRSLQLTFGAVDLSVPAYSVNIAGHDQLVQVERSADKFWFFPEKFSFFILDDKGARFYTLRQRLFSLGQDYVLRDEHGRRVGLVDGRLVSLGGYWTVTLEGDRPDPALDMTLQMFCAMLRFNKSARAHVMDLKRDIQAGRLEPELNRYEKDLYLNPRRTR